MRRGGPAAFAAVLTPARPWPRRCSTCCGRAMGGHARGPRRSSWPGWTRPRRASATRALAVRIPVAPCATGSTPRTGARRGADRTPCRPRVPCTPAAAPGRVARGAAPCRCWPSCCCHPGLLPDVAERGACRTCRSPQGSRLRQAILHWWHDSADVLDSAEPAEPPEHRHRGFAAQAECGCHGRHSCRSPRRIARQAQCRRRLNRAWWHFFGLLNRMAATGRGNPRRRKPTLTWPPSWDEAAQRRLIACCTARAWRSEDAAVDECRGGWLTRQSL